jgi:tetratricopeptide (TPR) repeat protein
MIPAVRFYAGLILTTLVIIADPLSWSQQQQTMTLVGEIKIARGSFPPHRIQVTLETRGATAQMSYADDEGKFLFAELWPNVYYVVINDPDFEPVRQAVEMRALSGNSTVVQVTLNPKDHGSQPGLKDHTSGGNPFLVSTSEYAKRYPKGALKEFDKANKAAQKGEADDAIRHFAQAVLLAPDFYAARNNLGLVYLGGQNFQNAEHQFQEVVRLNPSDSQAYFNLGNTYLLTKRFPQAAQAIQEGLHREPDSAFGQLLLGTVYSRTGNRTQSEQMLQHVLTIDQSMSKAHLELVNLYLQENKNSEAIAELKAFLKASPADPFAPKAREVLSRLEQHHSQ